MRRIWIDAAAVLLAATLLGGCATSKEKLLPHGDSTMLDIWHQETGGSAGGGQAARQLLDARQGLRRPLTEADVQAAPAAGALHAHRANEIYRQFHRLPNPTW
jgi:conjugative transfer region lipoprotein (TIGR03751 family)